MARRSPQGRQGRAEGRLIGDEAEARKKMGETVLAQGIVIALRLGNGPLNEAILCETPTEEGSEHPSGRSTPLVFALASSKDHYLEAFHNDRKLPQEEKGILSGCSGPLACSHSSWNPSQ